jgi:hypothetical protein
MRSEERLDEFYDELKRIHKEHFVDLRFGQFCSNLFRWLMYVKDVDPFFPEENKMLEYIKEYVGEIK